MLSATGGYSMPNASISSNITHAAALGANSSIMNLKQLAVQNATCAIAPLNRVGTDITKKCMSENTTEFMRSQDNLRKDIQQFHHLISTGQHGLASVINATTITPDMINK